jgi:hypothetical protein
MQQTKEMTGIYLQEIIKKERGTSLGRRKWGLLMYASRIASADLFWLDKLCHKKKSRPPKKLTAGGTIC